MRNVKREIEKFLAIVVLMLLPMFVIPRHIFAGDGDGNPEAKSESKADFVLTIKEGHISLSAKDASLKDVVEEIGRRMEIEVVANIPEEEKVTMEFEMLSLEDALERLSRNYVYEKKSEEGKITKIMLLPKGKGTALSIPVTKEPEVIEGQKVVRPESSALREKSQQPKPEEAEKEKSPHPEPFKFEFNP